MLCSALLGKDLHNTQVCLLFRFTDNITWVHVKDCFPSWVPFKSNGAYLDQGQHYTEKSPWMRVWGLNSNVICFCEAGQVRQLSVACELHLDNRSCVNLYVAEILIFACFGSVWHSCFLATANWLTMFNNLCSMDSLRLFLLSWLVLDKATCGRRQKWEWW